MNIGDIVMVIDTESIPNSFLGCYGIIINGGDLKVLVEFKRAIKGIGGLSHTVKITDLKKIGETNF